MSFDCEKQPHPAAEIFPLMAGTDFEALVADIREYGQREPIVVHDDLILDGRNRYRACIQLGVEPITTTWDGNGSPEAFVISKNLYRRHLTESQRAAIAARLVTFEHGGKRQAANLPVGISQQKAAEMLNVSERTVRHAATVIAKGAPELVQAVERGEIKVSTAAGLVGLSKARQREIAAAGGKLAGRLATKAAHQVISRHRRRARQSAEATRSEPVSPKETQHDRDLRWLLQTWEATCESARAAFLEKAQLLRMPRVSETADRLEVITPPEVAALPLRCSEAT